MKKKIKILHVIGSLKIGGAEKMAVNFYKYLDRDKFQCDYLVFNDDIGDYEKEVIELGGRIIHIPLPEKNYILYFKNLKRVIKEGKYDVVHSHTLLNNGLTLMIASKMNVKKRISHSHSTQTGVNENILYKFYSYIMRRLINKYATDIIACGKDAGIYLYGKQMFFKKGIIINNGIDVDNYKFDNLKSYNIRKKMGLKNELVIGHVGRMVPVKNHNFLIDIFSEICKINSESVLLIIGDGELRNNIEKKVKRLNLSKNVIFMGNRSDVADLLQIVDVFVFPSLYEGLPVSMIEAQAAGIPCVVSTGVTKEVKVTKNVKFISLNESSNLWANEIINYSKNKIDTRKELIERGFDIKTTIKVLEEIYE